MTVTNAALEAYAKSIINHTEEHEAVKERITRKLMERFAKSDFEGRQKIADIINANEIFIAELRIIVAENMKND